MPGQVKFCLLKNSGYRKRSERDYKGWVEDKNKYFCIFVTVFMDLAEEIYGLRADELLIGGYA